MSAWLLKKKSGTSMVRMRQYNKRFFTIDFDSRVFFYAHAEQSKKVSSVIRFCDLVDVRMADAAASAPEAGGDKGSKLRRSFSLTSGSGSKQGGEQAHHFITIVTKPSKTMELLCSSHEEAEQWHQAIKEAIVYGSGDDPQPISSSVEAMRGDDSEGDEAFPTVALAPPANDAAPTATRTADRVPTGAVAAAAIAAATAAVAAPTTAAAAAAAAGPDKQSDPHLAAAAAPAAIASSTAPAAAAQAPPSREAPSAATSRAAPVTEEPAVTKASPPASAGYPGAAAPPPAAPSPAAAEPAGPAAAAVAEPVAAAPAKAAAPVADAKAAADDEAAAPPVRGTFLDLSLEPAGPEATSASGSAPAVGAAGYVQDAQEAVVETGGMLQSSDFGFDADEDTASSNSAVSTPREGATDTFAGLGSPGGLAESPPAAAVAAKGDAGADRTYGDRHEGMSMQERLKNLEFSDDEDYDEDDPLGLGKSKA